MNPSLFFVEIYMKLLILFAEKNMSVELTQPNLINDSIMKTLFEESDI